MNVYKMQMPQEIYYGENSLANIGEIVKKYGSRVLLVSDEIIEKMGFVAQVESYLNDAGIHVSKYLGVKSEPVDAYLDEALMILRESQSDVIVAIGGGSPIDTAKAIAVVSTNGGHIRDYFQKKQEIKHPPLPMIAIPTTAGTGSEVTNVVIVTDTQENIKMMIKDIAFMPKVAIVDANTTKTAPPHVTAATGLDALCHSIESYISKKSHPLTKMFSLDATKLILNNIQAAFAQGDNMEARRNMSLASMTAGIAFSNASVTLVHGMSRPIGAMFHVPHGFSNAMLLPAVLEFTRNEAIDEMAELARLFLTQEEIQHKSNEELADSTIAMVKKLCRDLNIPNLRKWGIEQDAFEKALDKMATDALASGSPANNPRVATHAEIVDLYRVCYDYQA